MKVLSNYDLLEEEREILRRAVVLGKKCVNLKKSVYWLYKYRGVQNGSHIITKGTDYRHQIKYNRFMIKKLQGISLNLFHIFFYLIVNLNLNNG